MENCKHGYPLDGDGSPGDRCHECIYEEGFRDGQQKNRIDTQVREFHRVMGVQDLAGLGVPDEPTVRLRLRLVLEEAFELVEATLARAVDFARLRDLEERVSHLVDHASFSVSIVGVADALADIDYVVAGTRLAFGIDGDAVADEVHRANMAKAPGGIVKRNDFGKVVKPDGWTPPDVAGVLQKQRERETAEREERDQEDGIIPPWEA